MSSFSTSEDVYSDTSSWTYVDYYGCYRWLSRLVTKAPKHGFYRSEIQKLEIGRMNSAARAMLYVLVNEVPAAQECLFASQLRELTATAKPLDPPIILSDRSSGNDLYASMGVYL